MDTIGIDWDQAFQLFSKIMACEDEGLKSRAIVKLARISKHAPELALAAVVPIVIELLGSVQPSIHQAAAYCLCRLARRVNGALCPVIGQLGAIPSILRLIPRSGDGFRRILLRCLSSIVAFDDPNRKILATSGGLGIVLDLIPICIGDSRKYALEIISALALMREVRRILINFNGLPVLVEAVTNGGMLSRTRAAQAIGLMGISSRAQHMLVELGGIPALIGLLRDGEASSKLIAGNALGIVSSHVDYIKPLAQSGAISLYVELLEGPGLRGKEIAGDVFCLLAVEEENAVMIVEHLVRILRGVNEEAKTVAIDVLSDLSGYKHSIPVVRESGAIPLILGLLLEENDEVIEKASGAIAQLSFDEANRAIMAEEGVIPVLINLLRYEELMEYAAEALINFSKDPRYHEQVSEHVSKVSVMSSFQAAQDNLNRFRASDDHMFRSMRLMTVEQLTSDPDLI